MTADNATRVQYILSGNTEEILEQQMTPNNATNITESGDAFDDVIVTSLSSRAITVSDVIYRVVMPVICLFGIVGLFLTLVVLSRKNMMTSTNCYLMAFSGADFIFLLLFSSKLIEPQLNPTIREDATYVICATYVTIMMNVFLLASIWLTAILAAERYVAISRPFIADKICTVRSSALIISLTFLLSIICRLPNFWENSIVTYHDRTTNNTYRYVEATDFSLSDDYLTIYPWVVDGILTSVVPFLLLVLLNVSLIREVRRSTNYLKKNSIVIPATSSPDQHNSPLNNRTGSIQREELQITVMLIAIVMVFFVCQAPYVVYTAVVSVHRFTSPALIVLRQVTMLLLAIKSAINFIIYCWFSERFRATLKRLICRGRLINNCCPDETVFHRGGSCATSGRTGTAGSRHFSAGSYNSYNSLKTMQLSMSAQTAF